MDKKDIIIIVLAIVLVSATIVAIFSLGLFGEDMEEYDFGNFTMKVPAGTEFKFVEGGASDKYWTSDDLSVTTYSTKTLGDGLAGVSVAMEIKANGTLVPPTELDVTLNDRTEIYKMPDGTYKAIYNPDDLLVIVECNNLNDLEKMLETIKLKNATTNDNTTTSNSTTPTDTSSKSSSQEYGDWQTDEFTGEYDSNGNPIYKSRISSSGGGQGGKGIREQYWSSDGPISEERVG
jgi:hypothetical protein